MIFAELEYPEHYDEIHEALVSHVQAHFERVESGHQGDSWIWIFSGDDKVEIDTFYSMKHQVKSQRSATKLVTEVIHVLSQKYQLNIYSKPELDVQDEFD